MNIDNIDQELLNEFVDLIYSRIKEKFDKELDNANTEFYSEGIVNTVDGGKATVDLSFGTTEPIPNLTGQTINSGNKVKIYYNKNNMAGAYIGTVFK